MNPINNRFDFQDELDAIERSRKNITWVFRFHTAGSLLMAVCVYADTKIVSLASTILFLGSILASIHRNQLHSVLGERLTHATTSFMASRVHAGDPGVEVVEVVEVRNE